MALLELKHIGKQYGAVNTAAAIRVLDGINLTVQAGRTLAVVGPSGSGKSSLLNIIGTLDRPSSGSVTLDDEDLGKLSEEALAGLRNRKIGFVFQQHHLLPQCTVLENVLLPVLACHHSASERQSYTQRAAELLDRVGLSERQHHRPGQLSGGEAQRVAVVRALINRPSLLLADEPTGSLDQHSAQSLGNLLVELNQSEGTALMVVTHSMALAERMGRVLRLENGSLLPEG